MAPAKEHLAAATMDVDVEVDVVGGGGIYDAAGVAFKEAAGGKHLDEEYYSRQIYALGADTVQRMGTCSVLIVGARGVGVEIARHTVLAGAQTVVVYDDELVEASDLSAQASIAASRYVLREDDVGLNRAAASIGRLAELNKHVTIRALHGPLTDDLLKSFDVVVATLGNWKEWTQWDNVCRAHGVRFIAAGTQGLVGYLFVDVGDTFAVTDATGEPPTTSIIESITKDCPATVTVVEEQRHRLEEGSQVCFSGVEGMPELCNGAPRFVHVTGAHTFTIPDDTRKYGSAGGGGQVRLHRPPVFVSHIALETSILHPDIALVDASRSHRASSLHWGVQALEVFQQKHGGASPSPDSQADADEVLSLALELSAHCSVETGASLDEQGIRALARSCRAQLCPMAAIIGGLAAQEVQKACTGKYTPLHQWLYVDALECLPPSYTTASRDDFKPLSGSRFDAQIMTFGKSFQQTLGGLRYFLVGAGGLGNELLKNWALMGVGCGAGGSIHVTDNEVVEYSNLNRQFLYRPEDVKQPKSLVAASAILDINPQAKVKHYQERMGFEKDDVFDDDFYETLSAVALGVDNLAARLCMDAKCVTMSKPLLDGGVFGPKGHAQVFVPFLSDQYASSRDAMDKSTQICTLRNFPYAPEHTVEWARELFESMFQQRPSDVNAFLSSRDFLESLKKNPSQQLTTLETLRDALVRHKPLSFAACVEWARLQFEELYVNSIKQLLFNFPAHMKTVAGAPFWSGTKRTPKPLCFDENDALHLDFVLAASNLQAVVYGLKGCKDRVTVKDLCRNVVVSEFKPQEGVKIPVTDSEARAPRTRDADPNALAAACDRVLREMPTPTDLVGYRLLTLDFDLEDDLHMDFVVAAARLRAANYSITSIDRLQIKQIAGNIIPTLPSTTAVVAGLMCLEVYKLAQGRVLDAFRNSYFNLALPLLVSSQPVEAQKYKVSTLHDKVLEWTLWDRFNMSGVGLSLGEFLNKFKQEHGLEITMMSYGKSLLYAEFMRKKMEERMPWSLEQLITKVAKTTVPASAASVAFSISCTDAQGEDVEVPDVRVRIR
eukprot:jgi/Chlat1/4588/Chrsp290S04332